MRRESRTSISAILLTPHKCTCNSRGPQQHHLVWRHHLIKKLGDESRELGMVRQQLMRLMDPLAGFTKEAGLHRVDDCGIRVQHRGKLLDMPKHPRPARRLKRA